MKNTIIISDEADEKGYPDAIILCENDALNLYSAKSGEQVVCKSPNVDYVKVEDDFFEFFGEDYGSIRFDRRFVKLVINKSYYVGQKLKANKPYDIR